MFYIVCAIGKQTHSDKLSKQQKKKSMTILELYIYKENYLILNIIDEVDSMIKIFQI